MIPRRLAERRLRRWLWLYPPRYRRRYGDDMVACFLERQTECALQGRDPRRLWRQTRINIARTALAEWRHSSLDADALGRGRHTPRQKGDLLMATVWQDLRYTTRTLRRRPAYALFVVLTLGLGIGLTATVFSLVNGVLLRPLPFPESERLVSIQGRFLPESGFDFPSFPLSNPEYMDFRDGIRSLSGVAAYSVGRVTVGGGAGDPERVVSAAVTPNLFEVLRLPITQGRGFLPAEGVPGAPAAAVISHGLWQTRFGGRADLVGQTILMNNVPVTVVGVAPKDFAYPVDDVQVWRPLTIDPANPGGRSNHGISAIGRLAAGATLEQLEAETALMMDRWKTDYPTVHTGHFLFVIPEINRVVGDVGNILIPLFGATGLLLLIVCANVSSVSLARGESRVREMAVRAALGADRRRLIRLALSESLLLGVVGGALGLAAAFGALRILVSLEGSGLPRVHAISIDWAVLLFSLAASVLAAVIVGAVPAVRAAAGGLESTLRQDLRTASASGGRMRFRRLLVAAEVALTVVLVLAAGLMLRSLTNVTSIDPGFDAAPDTLMATISLPAAKYTEPAQVHTFYDDLLTRLTTTPGIEAASASSFVPFYTGGSVWDFRIEGRPPALPGQPALNAGIGAVRPGFLELIEVPLVRGRTFTAADRGGAEPVVLINQALATKFFAGQDPIGQRMGVAGDTVTWMRIVGVVGDVRHGNLEDPAQPMYYFAHAQTQDSIGGVVRQMTVALKASVSADDVASALRSHLKQQDPTLPVVTVTSLGDAVGSALAEREFATTLFAVFAGVGLVLGATGIYGVLAYAVAQRRQEIGIRRALGASSNGVAKLMITQALVPVGIGLVTGLGVAAFITKWIEGQLFGVAAFDLATYAGVAIAVAAVAVLASAVPIRRALQIDPGTALRP